MGKEENVNFPKMLKHFFFLLHPREQLHLSRKYTFTQRSRHFVPVILLKITPIHPHMQGPTGGNVFFIAGLMKSVMHVCPKPFNHRFCVQKVFNRIRRWNLHVIAS